MKNDRLNGKLTGKDYWRSLDQLADTPEFRDFLQREFPEGASELRDSVSRRTFLSLMGASIALAGVAGCRKPVEKILPYVTAPENVIPGIPQHYATTMPFGTTAYGVLVENHEGRPTKIEGNELHPSTRGASNAFMQASILGLYDPDRSQRVMDKGSERTWADFVSAWRTLYEKFSANQGAGLAVLSESFNSPTLARLVREFKAKFPQAVWATYEPVSAENIFEGARVATGKPLQAVYSFDAADVIFSLDSDFLKSEADNVSASRGYGEGRRITSENDSMNRLYVVESTYSLTGSVADHRMRVSSKNIASVAAVLAKELASQGLNLPVAASLNSGSAEIDSKWLRVAASDLMKSRGKSIVCAGYRQPAAVHALVVAINEALGNVGAAVNYIEPIDAQLPNRPSFSALVQQMSAGQVDTLLVIGGNPVFNAPADVNFVSALGKVPNTINLSLYRDETAHKVNWHLPMAHYLESWGDARSSDGTASVVQPMIEPLFGGHSAVELLSLITSGEDKRGYDIVRQTWGTMIAGSFEKGWRKVLHDGLLADSSAASSAIAVNAASVAAAMGSLDKSETGLEVVFAASPQLHDGRFANNGWLMEMPHPITKITWDNVAMISIATAKQLGVKSGELIQLTVGGRSLELPVWLVPGHADNSVTVELGYGRTIAGRVGDKVGFDAYVLRGSDAFDIAGGAAITKLGRDYPISSAQDHWSMEGRPLVREANLEDYRKDPTFAQEMVEHPPLESLWDEPDYSKGNQWGMSVDLNTCTGCGACTLACQSENNIPIVGKAQVAKGREMHWLRIDRYFSGEIEDAEMVHQPVMCQHCENAPCEQVCPVAATVHDKEGLNVMVYNRCIGTRYCSNNCPYKVRRFNYFNFTKDTPEIVKMAMNPDVTVRFRGVMEKCTFCVQRISEARIKSKLESREVRDGDITTACQQACPTKALTFGNINDPNSRVSKLKSQNRNYAMLAELNVKPRLTYLARIRNPHPELATAASSEHNG